LLAVVDMVSVALILWVMVVVVVLSLGLYEYVCHLASPFRKR
jgi:hypothetical protein